MNQYLVQDGSASWKELLLQKEPRLEDVLENIKKFIQDIDKKYYLIWDCKPFFCSNTFKNFTGLESDITKYFAKRMELTCEVKIKIKVTKQYTLEVCISRDMWMFPFTQARSKIMKVNENSDLLLQQFDDSVNQARQQLQFYKRWEDVTVIAFERNGHHQDTPRDETYSIVMKDSNRRKIKINPCLNWLKVEQTGVKTIMDSFFDHQNILPNKTFDYRGNRGDERLSVFSTQFYKDLPYERDDRYL